MFSYPKAFFLKLCRNIPNAPLWNAVVSRSNAARGREADALARARSGRARSAADAERTRTKGRQRGRRAGHGLAPAQRAGAWPLWRGEPFGRATCGQAAGAAWHGLARAQRASAWPLRGRGGSRPASKAKVKSWLLIVAAGADGDGTKKSDKTDVMLLSQRP